MVMALEERPLDSPLTSKQERFCQEYVLDYNGAAAARRAGFAKDRARRTAGELLAKRDILARVREVQAEQHEAWGNRVQAAVGTLMRALSDPEQALFAAKVILDQELKLMAHELRVEEVGLKKRALALREQGEDPAKVNLVLPWMPEARDEREFEARVAERLRKQTESQRVRAGGTAPH